MSVINRRSFKTAIFSSYLKVAMATSSFMNKIYSGGFVSAISISVLKEIDSQFRNYIYIEN